MAQSKAEDTTTVLNVDELGDKEAEGNKIINNNVLWSLGIGLIPLPVVDLLGTTAIQIRMLNQLTTLYGIEFSENWGKSTIGALLGGLGSRELTRVGLSMSKMIPVFGTILGIAASPVASGASTYAIGKVFHQHFASGGTFLDFNPEKVRDHFARLYKEGKLVVSNLSSK